MKIIKSKLFIIITSTILVLALLVTGAYFYFQNQLTNEKALEITKDAYNNNPILSPDEKYPLKAGFNGYVRDLKYEVVVSKEDIFKPVIALIRASFQDTDQVKDLYDINNLYLERTGISSWKVIDYRYSTSTKTSFDEIKTLASKYDITTNFPDKDKYNINNYPPLTQGEVESNRNKRGEQLKNELCKQELNESAKSLKIAREFQIKSIDDMKKAKETLENPNNTRDVDVMCKIYRANNLEDLSNLENKISGLQTSLDYLNRVSEEQYKKDYELLKSRGVYN